MRSLEVTSGESKTSFKKQTTEVMATAGGCCDCQKLRWVAGEARNMTENALYILIVIFPNNSNESRPQTEGCVAVVDNFF